MNFKKIVPVFAMALGLSFTALAGTPEKANSKTETATNQDDVTTYYVTGGSGSNYTISLTQNKPCNGGTVPCKFTSPDPNLGSSIPKATVDGELNDIEILEFRSVL